MPEFAELVEGYHRFRDAGWEKQRSRWADLSHGQSPAVMIIGCCDSRVDPATVFDTVPGQVFSLRNVANLVPPFETGGGLHGASAAIEFGVLGLEVKHIVVLGHAKCGGIRAALSGEAGNFGHGFVDEWMKIIDDAKARVMSCHHDDPQEALELEGIRTSIANLRTFPFVAEREAAGTLKIHGAYFGIEDGVLHVLDQETGEFVAS